MSESENSLIKARQIVEETVSSKDISQIEGYAPEKLPLIQDILKSYFEMIQTLPSNKFHPPLAHGNPVVGLMKLSTKSLGRLLKELRTLRDIYDLSVLL